MSQPIHETLRAAGQGILCGTLVAVPLAFAAYLGPVGFAAAAVSTGTALITVANALKRRDQRKAKEWA